MYAIVSFTENQPLLYLIHSMCYMPRQMTWKEPPHFRASSVTLLLIFISCVKEACRTPTHLRALFHRLEGINLVQKDLNVKFRCKGDDEFLFAVFTTTEVQHGCQLEQ